MDVMPAPGWVADVDAEGWREGVLSWISTVLGELGRPPTGTPSVHKARPWSIVLRVPTRVGPVWFKQNLPTLGPEPALLTLVSEQVPGRVPAPLAADLERGWLLLDDHGPTLRARGGDGDPRLWADLVMRWSQTTRALAGVAGRLAAIGVPSLGPAQAEPYLRRRIADLASLPSGDPAHLTADDARRLDAFLPMVRRAGEELAALGLPDTLWHNDLHTNNVFDTPGGLLFFDFGDALVGSPLCDLLIPLRFFADARGAEFGFTDHAFADPGLARIVEAAIEPWTDLAPAGALRRAVPAALLLGVLGRSEGWRRALPAGDHGEFAGATRDWLLELAR